MITQNVKQLIEKQINLIDDENFKMLFDIAGNLHFSLSEISILRLILESSGMKPLYKMYCVPTGYFYGDPYLTSFKIPINIQEIRPKAFSDCSVLEEVTISNKLKYIGYDAFYGCLNLKKIYFCGTYHEWGLIEKDYTWHQNSRIESVVCLDGEHYDY